MEMNDLNLDFTKAIIVLDKYDYNLYASHDVLLIGVKVREMSARDIIDVLKYGLSLDKTEYKELDGFGLSVHKDDRYKLIVDGFYLIL